TGFETTIPVMKADTLNVAFKDCANHWDNNSGMNYSFDVIQ
ncbi:MAG: carbohydrate-binding protein, partial [Ruminiclostridium sp.]|nr:carbohydrate-binding protein [Ruminiclostridium sp.]